MTNCIEIRTKRFTLKRLENHDKKQLIKVLNDYRVSDTLANVPYPYKGDDAEYWLNNVRNNKYALNIFFNNLLIGGIGIHKEDDGYNLGYWVGFEYWGKGYATESCYGLLNYLKKNTSHQSIKAKAFIDNNASNKVLEKIGFKYIEEAQVFSKSRQENVHCLDYEYILY